MYELQMSTQEHIAELSPMHTKQIDSNGFLVTKWGLSFNDSKDPGL